MTQPAAPKAITVRLCTEEDLPAVRERMAEPQLADVKFELQEEGDYFFLLGFVDGELAGNVILDYRATTKLRTEVRDLWVYVEHRRQGVGAALSADMEARAAELGFDEILLGVDPENPAAIPMYISLDYTPTGNHRTVTTRDADGNTHQSTEAIFRKSLHIRR